MEDFNRLPAEAIFVLIDGFNRTANMEASCPTVVIGKKIIKILNASDDLELLAFAKENLGAGVTAKRHLGMLKDVQFSILLRKGTLQRRQAIAGAAGTRSESTGSLSVGELVKAADTNKGAPTQIRPDRAGEAPSRSSRRWPSPPPVRTRKSSSSASASWPSMQPANPMLNSRACSNTNGLK